MSHSQRSQVSETDSDSIHSQLRQAFETPPDSGGIIQGVRHFRRGRPHIRLVMAPSPKNGGLMPCEGRLEALMALNLELDPDVRQYRCQPFAIPSARGPATVPDFAVKRNNGTFSIIDVKPEEKLSVPKIKTRMQQVRSILKAVSLPHTIVTDTSLEARPYAHIRQALRKASTTVITEPQKQSLTDLLEKSQKTVGELRRHLIQRNQNPLYIEKLALLGNIKFSTNHDWNEFTKLEASHGTDQELTSGWGTVRTVRIPV